MASAEQFCAIFGGAGEDFQGAKADVFDEECQFASVVTVGVPGEAVVTTHSEAAAGSEDHAGTFGSPVQCFLVPINDSL